MKNHYELLKTKLYQSIDTCMHIQDTQEDDSILPTYLYTATANKGLTDGLDLSFFVSNFIVAYYLEDSPYYHNDDLLERAYRAYSRYETYLREDGSADLLSTNFHDPAQTGFHAQVLFYSTEMLAHFTRHTEIEEKLFEKIKEILRKTGHAMSTLGFHTPNHRWAISGALAIAYRYTGEKEFLDTINRFLMEGIDCDEHGEYTERSTGCYNNVCNHSFMLLGYYLDKKEFYEYPRRNLNLMYHFTEPDNTVNTLNSTRWDNGGEYNISPYYDWYLLLALMDKNPEFAYTADSILDQYGIPSTTRIAFILTVLATHPELLHEQEVLVPKAPEKDKSIFLPNSRIARVYKPELNLTMTALASRTPVFFQMNYGSSILQIRYAGSFFGDPHSAFRARTIIPTEDGYRLICDENAGYRSQFNEKPETSNWRQMDHSKRQIINVQNFHTEITVHILKDGVSLDIETSGCERIPTKLEISMQSGGKLFTDSINMISKEGDYIFLKGNAEYFIDGYRYFEIEGGFCKHLNGDGMRGTSPVNPKKFTIALTDTTPQKSTVTIRAKNILK